MLFRAAKMKTKASGFLKQVVSLVMSMVKAKSVAVKSKASAVKTRLIIFGLLRNKKVLMSAISHKIQALMGQLDHQQDKRRRATAAAGDDDDVDNSKAIVLYSAVASDPDHQVPPPDDHVAASAGSSSTTTTREMVAEYYYHGGGGGGGGEAGADVEEDREEDDGYPDLRHSLFDEEDDHYLRGLGDDGTGSVIDLVKNSRGEDQGEFVLEDEIDHVADVFIMRFHRQMRMQKLDSFKRYQEMLERSA